MSAQKRLNKVGPALLGVAGLLWFAVALGANGKLGPDGFGVALAIAVIGSIFCWAGYIRLSAEARIERKRKEQEDE